MSRMSFELLGSDGAARRGRITFPRGTIETPAFMPVGTYGSVKGALPHQVRELGAEIILGNTFHLFLRPGLAVIEAHGGLHGFARWDRPIGWQLLLWPCLWSAALAASAFAGLLRSWMEGSRRREQALAYVAEADARAAGGPAWTPWRSSP